MGEGGAGQVRLVLERGQLGSSRRVPEHPCPAAPGNEQTQPTGAGGDGIGCLLRDGGTLGVQINKQTYKVQDNKTPRSEGDLSSPPPVCSQSKTGGPFHKQRNVNRPLPHATTGGINQDSQLAGADETQVNLRACPK